MKIVILVDQFYKHGGIEKLVAIKANYWSAVFGYDVNIISTENKGNPLIYKLNSKISFDNLNIDYNRKKSYFSVKNIFLLLKNLYKIQKYIINKKPNFVIVASHIPITYVLPFLWKRKTKIIKEIHFTQFYRTKRKKNIKSLLFKFIESHYDKIIVLSKEEKTFYTTDNIEVIANPIEGKSNTDNTAIIGRQNIATTVARFAPVKRLELLVAIWDKLIKNGIEWELHIYGNYKNEYGKTISELIKEKKLENFVFLKGVTNDVNNVLKTSRVSLLTSAQECFPMIILESFSVSVPVISFDCPTGPRNIIKNNKNGILIENNNIDAFVNSFEKFAKSITLQKTLAKGAYESSNNYQIDQIMNQWNSKIFN